MFIMHSDQHGGMSTNYDCCCPSIFDTPRKETPPKDCSKGYAYIAQGATGRWCEVLWLCNDCGDKANSENTAVNAADARKMCNDSENSYADF